MDNLRVPIIGFGAGGHARVMIEILRFDQRYELAGLLDPREELRGESLLGIPVLGDDNLLPDLLTRGITHFFIGLGGTGNLNPRRKLYELARSFALMPVDAIHPSVIISPSVQIGVGFSAMPNSVVNACATIGENVILNTGAIIEHDCVIGSHVHIATGARLASTVQVGEGAHIGAGATVRQCALIGAGAIVGVGAVVVKDVLPGVVVAGVPARPLIKRDTIA